MLACYCHLLGKRSKTVHMCESQLVQVCPKAVNLETTGLYTFERGLPLTIFHLQIQMSLLTATSYLSHLSQRILRLHVIRGVIGGCGQRPGIVM